MSTKKETTIDFNKFNDNYNKIITRLAKYEDNKGNLKTIPLTTLEITISEAKNQIKVLQDTISEIQLQVSKTQDESYKGVLELSIVRVQEMLNNFIEIEKRMTIYYNFFTQGKIQEANQNRYLISSKLELKDIFSNSKILKEEIKKYKNYQEVLNISLNVDDNEEKELEKNKSFIEIEIVFFKNINKRLEEYSNLLSLIKKFKNLNQCELEDLTKLKLKESYILSIKDIENTSFVKEIDNSIILLKNILKNIEKFDFFVNHYLKKFELFLNYSNRHNNHFKIYSKLKDLLDISRKSINLSNISIELDKLQGEKEELEVILSKTEKLLDLFETTRIEESVIFIENLSEVFLILDTWYNSNFEKLFKLCLTLSEVFYLYQRNNTEFSSLTSLILTDYTYISTIDSNWSNYIESLKKDILINIKSELNSYDQILMKSKSFDISSLNNSLSQTLNSIKSNSIELKNKLNSFKNVSNIISSFSPVYDYITTQIDTSYGSWASNSLQEHIIEIQKKLVSKLLKEVRSSYTLTTNDLNNIFELENELISKKNLVDFEIQKFNQEVFQLKQIYSSIYNYSYSSYDSLSSVKNNFFWNSSNLELFWENYIIWELEDLLEVKYRREKDEYEERKREEERRRRQREEEEARRRRNSRSSSSSSSSSWGSSSSWSSWSSSFSSSWSYGWSSSF